MYPNGTFADARGGHQAAAVGRDGYALFFRGAEADLLRRATGKTLPPDMIAVSRIGAEVHGLAIRAPARVSAASRLRTGCLAPCAPIERQHPARPPPCSVH